MKRNKQKLVSLILAVVMAVSMISQIVPAAFAVTTVWDGSVADSFESGSGMKGDPYVIKTAEQLAYLAASVNGGNDFYEKHFRLEADILLNDTTNWKNWGSYTGEGHLIAPVNSWTPIGEIDDFRGYFDGGEHSISGLYLNDDYYGAGLFGRLRDGEISNLSIRESYIQNVAEYPVVGVGTCGGVAGSVSGGTVSNCRNAGIVTGNNDTGGVVGSVSSESAVSNCRNSGPVTGSSMNTGGVAGYVYYDSAVSGCCNTGPVTGSGQYSSYTGGVVGSVDQNGTVSGCCNEGTVTGSSQSYSYTGGVIGSGSAANCYNTGAVNGSGENSYTGGVAGSVEYGDTISDCYNTGAVTGSGDTGGVAGYVVGDSTVSNCYNTGTIKSQSTEGELTIGGVAGSVDDRSTVGNCYYLSGCAENGNGYGTALTETQMRQKDSYENWNFHKTWEFLPGAEYPYPTQKCFGSKEYYYNVRFFDGKTLVREELLKVGTAITLSSPEKEDLDFEYWRNDEKRYYAGNTFVPVDDIDFQAIWTTRNTSATVWNGDIDTDWEGNGTEKSPFLISSAEELAGLARRTGEGRIGSGTYFRQTKDIVLNDGGDLFWDDIAGKNEWTPIGNSSNAFWGNFDGGGHTVSGLYIRGNFDGAGLFGYISGGEISNVGIENSYIYNKSFRTGGIAGSSQGVVKHCWNDGVVKGESRVGGVVGHGYAIDCRNTGTVVGSYITGGVVGSVEWYGTVSDCYNEGTVTGSSYTGGVVGYGSANNCFNKGTVTGGWDTGGVVGSVYQGIVSGCRNEGTVTGSDATGGVAGYVGSSGTVRGCYNDGDVTGSGDYDNDSTGGVAGNVSGTVSGCYNDGDVTGNGSTGGVAGNVSGTVSDCYNAGAVKNNSEEGESATGGVVGKIAYSAAIRDCYNTGEVSGGTGKAVYTGGVVGLGSDGDAVTVKNCYNTGRIKSGTGSDATYAGGVAGRINSGTATGCYYLSGCLENGNDTGAALSEEQMRRRDSYEQWNFNKNWEFLPGAEYPYPTLKCFGSKEYYYNVRFFDGKTLVREELIKAGTAITLSAPEKEDLDFKCWRKDEGWYYYAGDTFVPADDTDFQAIWTTRNTSATVWNGDIDTDWEGNGTESSPFLISSAEELAGLARRTNEGRIGNGAYFRQTEDIVLNDGGDLFCDDIAGKNEWTPIGNGSNAFRGSFDGGGHTVSGLYIRGDLKYAGLFGRVYGDRVSGVGIKKSYVYNTGSYTGGVAGSVEYGSAVSDCYNEGVVIGGWLTGGVAGLVEYGGTISGCYNAGPVTGKGGSSCTGGVVGHGSVNDCFNEGAVIGSSDTGGVVGEGSATGCSNKGEVTGGRAAGGVVGIVSNTISDCHNEGKITGGEQAGGIAGDVGFYGGATYYHINSSFNKGEIYGAKDAGGIAGAFLGTVSDCYNAGEIKGGQKSGGIVGSFYSEGIVTACYNVGTVKGGDKDNAYTGGVAGKAGDDITVSSSYYLSGCAENGNSHGAALSAEQMKTAAAFEGFDFDEYWEIGTAEGYEYPTLQNVKHDSAYTVTFIGRDGEVLGRQSVRQGEDADPPAVQSYSDGNYLYAFDHWNGRYSRVIKDSTVTAVYKKVEIIRFNDIGVSFTVENGFSEEQLRVRLDSYFSRKLCTTTKGYKMMCEVVWDEKDLLAYDPGRAGEYIIGGTLKITDPAYSQFAGYYDMAQGSSVRVSVTVLPEDGQVVEFERDDLRYEVLKDGSSAVITGYTGAAAEIVLPEKIGAYTVTAIADGAFAGNKTLTMITVPATVKTVGNNAFGGCSSLMLATFENGVASIGAKAFYDTDLVSVTLPDSVTAIGEKAFGYYGGDRRIEGYAIYCMPETAAEQYAAANGIDCHLIGEQSDGETGVSVITERDVTLVVAQVEQGAFFESAQQIVQENDNVSLFEIKIVDDQSREVQPGSLLTVSVPVPDGFDADTCEVFRINTDGTYQAMHAKLIDGKLVFTTPHLSYYAIVEGITHLHTPGVRFREREVPATCEAAGSYDEVIYCSKCNEELSREKKTIPAFGHKWAGKYTVDKYPTAKTTGVKSIHCTVCGVVKPGSAVKIERLTDPAKAFSDISSKAWYYGAVSYAVNNGLFAGSDGKFDPDGDMTRGMFVSVLARMAGVKVNNNVTTKFTDVKKGQWYAGAVKWASDNGIVTGSGGRFMPNDPITREQICTILVTYSKYMKITLTPTTKAVTFKDAKKISKWAKSAVATCQKAGLIAGSNGSFDPKGKATRAAVAQILMQFDKNFG